MNLAFQATKTALHGTAEMVIAGQRAVCDPSGALYLESDRILVVSDLHFEKGSSFARRGMMLPPYDTATTLAALAKVIARYNPVCVISLGDSFHDGDAAARLPALYAAELAVLMAGREWIWITGNHDPEHPANLPGETFTELALGNLVFRHEPSKMPCPGEIAGHLHPAAKVVRRGQAVQRRCFASDQSRMIMPAFGAYTGGLNILGRAFHGLFDAHAITAYMLGHARVYPMIRKALYL
ncbi:ligase-associated DNA damage response endonuclease PdeM [Phyllobacterium zundukense]|uniref:Metallophosphatase n=1 Tax=Phyllobacterium zundukense TaxID=1867719 RepID=A0A2N9VXM9_9HYPH|nr:metallophosphatase [Phyllobacterium zundukense]PIO44247.1 metallophosphatase [Phyllobacterium zundukense]